MNKHTSSRKRVIVVGAGPCGLPALKEMLAGGHDATTFERASSLGGVFASSAMYHDLHLTLSNWAMAFSDFPNKDLQCYPTGEEYLQYLKDYTSHFDLERHIKYNTEVISASLGENGKWVLQVREGTQRRVEHADALVVATGAHQVPKALPGQLAGFSGRVVHSSNYSDAFRSEVKEKQLRVLLVGGGESGADISADLGDLTSNTTVWLRRPNCFGPRYLVADHEMPQIKDSKQRRYPVNSFLESATTNRMSAAQNVFFYGFWRRLLWKLPILNKKLSEACLDSTASAWLMNDQATYVTKNQRMCEAWGDGKIEVLITPEVMARGRSVKFQMPDGRVQEREFDAIVLCTGYTAQFPWLKVKGFDPNPRSWYLHCFPGNLGDKLFFSGYARPHQGGIPPMAEIQSRYVSLILKGERKLPKDYVARGYRDKITEREYYSISPDLDSLVDWNAFLESVARRVGCEARLPAVCVAVFNVHLLAVAALALLAFAPNLCPIGFKTAALLWGGTLISFFVLYDGLMIKWWFYPHWPIWYRQRGPDANPTLVSEIFSRSNIWRDTKITRGFVLLVFWSWWTYYAQRVISLFFFIPHTLAKWYGVRFGKAWGGFFVPKIFTLHDTEWRFSDLLHP
ncbi:FAD/NAD(P)-binding domain-containing protein [Periconia macrospinosa]|uniref:FAD/NAD(P)-binding domain-containing protein n=1 Tax=Periconia macrospinosa TaxID=97972 RepID=A0A2V1D9T1_9PLEO|nr:FAD/NAD(P)-binding domain-containing protein [Periconia macrospinosa]